MYLCIANKMIIKQFKQNNIMNTQNYQNLVNEIEKLVKENNLANEFGVVDLTEPVALNGGKEEVVSFNVESGDVYLEYPCDLFFGINVDIETVEGILKSLRKQIAS